MQNVVFTQLSITEFRKLIREEQEDVLEKIFNEIGLLNMMSVSEWPERFISKNEAASIGGIPVTTVESWLTSGCLTVYRFGDDKRIKLSELMTYLEAQAG